MMSDAESAGSKAFRFLKVAALGSAATAAFAVAYLAISLATGVDLSLALLVVGFAVGGAVRVASGRRGGLGYQFLAIFLTYTAIVAMLIPLALRAAAEYEERWERAAQEHADTEVADEDGPRADVDHLDSVRVAAPQTWGQALQLLIEAVAIAYTMPILVIDSLPRAGLMYGAALWVAWALNRKPKATPDGPRSATDPGIVDVPGPSGEGSPKPGIGPGDRR